MREPASEEKEAPWEGVSEAAASAGLYEGHEIKLELVIGPEVLKPPDAAYALPAKKSQLNSVEVSDAESRSVVSEQNLKESSSTDKWKNQVDQKQHASDPSCSIASAVEINPTMEKKNEESIHTKDIPLQCKVCSRQFSQKQYLTRHMRTHLVKKLYPCTACKKQFKQKIELVTHMKNHTVSESFPCDVCNKQFASTRNLISHKRMHAGDTPYSCDACDKKFSHKSYLRTHKRIHAVEKRYSCDVCGKQFAAQYQVSRHKQCHIVEKPYTCKNCKKQFAQNKYFVRHIFGFVRCEFRRLNT